MIFSSCTCATGSDASSPFPACKKLSWPVPNVQRLSSWYLFLTFISSSTRFRYTALLFPKFGINVHYLNSQFIALYEKSPQLSISKQHKTQINLIVNFHTLLHQIQHKFISFSGILPYVQNPFWLYSPCTENFALPLRTSSSRRFVHR